MTKGPMMKPRTNRLAEVFLAEITGNNLQDTFESLLELMMALENKNDPEQVELYLIENIHVFMEKLRILEHNLKSYVKDNRGKNKSAILERLYEETNYGASTGNRFIKD